MEWIKLSQYNLPAQGLKILCFKQGDLWVCRRFNYDGRSIWVEIPFGGNDGTILTDEPEYWAQVELMQGYTGMMQVGLDNAPVMTFDEFEKKHPKNHKEFVKMFIFSGSEKKARNRLNAM